MSRIFLSIWTALPVNVMSYLYLPVDTSQGMLLVSIASF